MKQLKMDALFIATEWPEFKNPNFKLMGEK
jgi:UDPglucose 6-dehydrogenase